MLKRKKKKLFEANQKDFHLFKKHIKPCREAVYKLKKFIAILNDYQKKMNLIGQSTMSSIWTRHILDSAQIEKILPEQNKKYFTVDVGTGAGFPGIVLAALGRQDLLLCEKSIKKNIFLNTVAKECNIEVKMYNDKVENLKVSNVKNIVSRAFAPLKSLLVKVKHCLRYDTTLVLHKGKTYMIEIVDAKNFFSFNYKCYSSFTNPESKIIKIENVREKNEQN